MLGAVSLVGEGNDLGTELRRLWPLVHNTSVGLGTAGPHMPPPQDKLQGRRSHSQCPLPLARAVQTWPCINIPEGSSVSPGCPLGRQQLAVRLEAICECLWSNTWKGNANAVPACFLAWTQAGGARAALGQGAEPPPKRPHLELVVRAEQEGLLVVTGATEAVGA